MDCTTVRLVDGGYVKIKITPEIPVKDILVSVLKKVSPETLQHDRLSLYGLFLSGNNKRTYLCIHRLWSEVVRSLNLDGSFPFSLELNILVFPILYLTFIRENPTSFQYLMKQIKKSYFDNIAENSEFKDQVLLLGCLELRRYFENRDPLSKGALDMIEKKFGFAKFFPPNIIAQHKPKQFKKVVNELLRKWCSVPSDDADFKFMDVLKEIKNFESTEIPCALGAGFASVDVRLVISPKNAIAFRIENSSELKRVGEFADLIEVRVDIPSNSVRMMFNGKEEEPLVLTFATIDEADFVAHLVDAYRLDGATQSEENTVLYHGCAHNEGPDNESVYGGEDYAAFEYGTFGRAEPDDSPYRELPRHQIVLERMLGEGQFGDVYRGVMREGAQDTQVAVKTSKDGQDDAATQKFLEEAKTMSQFDHPHIIRLIGVIKERPVWIVMELAPLGELRPYLLEKADSLTSATLILFCYEISSALCYLEMKNIIHRDIAARNVLVSTAECVKLADFGMTRWLQENQPYTATQGKLPLKWMAPESIHLRRFSSASDVWMFGVCMWEILQCGMKPFQGVKNNDAIQMIESGRRLAKPQRCPDSAYRLMNQCWSYEASKRPTFAILKPQLCDIMNEERKTKTTPAVLSRAPSVPVRCGALPPPPKPSTPNMNVSVDDIINQSMPSLHVLGPNGGPGHQTVPKSATSVSKVFPAGDTTATLPSASKQPLLPPVPSSPRAEESGSRPQSSFQESLPPDRHQSESPPVMRRFPERSKSFENKNLLKNTLGTVKSIDIRKSISLENLSTAQEKDDEPTESDQMLLDDGYRNVTLKKGSQRPSNTATSPTDGKGASVFDSRPTDISNPNYVDSAAGTQPRTQSPSGGYLENVYSCVVNIVKSVHTLNARVSAVDATECARLVSDIGYKLKLLRFAVETLIEKGSFSQSRIANLKLAQSVVNSDFADLYDAVKLAVGASHIPRLYRDYCVDVLQKAHALAIDSRHIYEAACAPEPGTSSKTSSG